MDLTQPIITERRLATFWGAVKTWLKTTGTSKRTQSLYYGHIDSTSTRTVMTAQIDGITEYFDGLCVILKNGVAASNTGVTLNINNLGAKKIYYSTALNTAITTQLGESYTVMLYYDSERDGGAGAWVYYYGYDSNTNTIGYQLRTNSLSMPMKERMYRYRIFFTSADGLGYVPFNTSTSTNATTARTPTTEKINPFGAIHYYGTTAALAAGERPSVTTLYTQYGLTIGYSYVYAMTAWKPVYLVTHPQTDGSVIIDATTPLTQTPPSTEDGLVYIFMGVAYSSTAMELTQEHPVYWYKDGAVRQWTNAGYQTASDVSTAIQNALAAYENGNTSSY